MKQSTITSLFLIAILTLSASSEQKYVNQSGREIPVAYEVDIAVIGGTTYGVETAAAAAKNGAEVFLAAPRPYLGEDLCATYRFWLENGEKPETELAKRLFKPTRQEQSYNPLPFSYKSNLPSASIHPDTKTSSKLMDGKFSSASRESVQYDGDVSIIAEMKEKSYIEMVHVMAYQRRDDFVVDTVDVFISDDGKDWTHITTIENPSSKRDNHESGCLDFKANIDSNPSFIKLEIKREPGLSRVLLGEIIFEDKKADKPKKEQYANPTTPFQVKYELDQALLDVGAKFLYSTMVTDVLIDEEGDICGFIMANRSGRQAVLAKLCIDATIRGDFARMAGARFEGYPTGKQTFKRIVVGGEPQKASQLSMRTMPSPVMSEANKARTQYNTFDAYEYTLEIPMEDSSFASFAKSDQIARDLSWRPGQVDGSEIIYQKPPDQFIRPFSNAKSIPQFYMTKIPGLVVLGEYLSDGPSPLKLMKIGRQLGEELAVPKYINKSIPKTIKVKSIKTNPCEEGDIKEFLDGLRNIDTGKTIRSNERSIPVIGEYDVVVVGGGTGGAPAGIGAARRGAKTLVVEYLHGLGGVGTHGLIGSYYFGYKEGFTSEIDAGVAEMKDLRENRRGWNVENKMEWYRSELRKAGADIWFGCMGSGAFVEDGKVKGAVVITPQGRGVVLCDVLIDSTGNADIAAAAGADTIFQGPENAALQGTGLPPRMLNENYTNTDYTFIYDDDMLDLWRAFVIVKEKFKGAYDIAQIVDSRERRRIIGDFSISPLDILNDRTYPDTVSLARSNFDTHGYTIHPYFAIDHPDKSEKIANVPYRALLPKGMDGIIVTGLGISAHRDAMPILRMQACIQNQGYAMGAAASMASKEDGHTRAIDIKQLQKHLVEIGSLPERVLTDTDSYPYSQEEIVKAVESVASDFEGLKVILAQPEDALPHLQEAYKAVVRTEHDESVPDRSAIFLQKLTKEQIEKGKINYAHILGMMGDPTGKETLLETVASTPWDKGWSFTGMGQFGGSLSPLDSKIIAMAKTGDNRAVDIIKDKMETLDANSEFSHHRAVAVALETLKAPEAAEAIVKLLQKPGMSGHAWTELYRAKMETPQGFNNDTSVRDRTLRELILARALYRCGDHKGMGEKILKQYANDIRAHYSKHAKSVLAEGE